MQAERFRNSKTRCNSDMLPKQLEKLCILNEKGHQLLGRALKSFRLSGRAHDSILKVSRTIADLEQSERIQLHHLAEAVNYRSLDKEVAF